MNVVANSYAPAWTPGPTRMELWLWSRSKKKGNPMPRRERVFYNIDGTIVTHPENLRWMRDQLASGKWRL